MRTTFSSLVSKRDIIMVGLLAAIFVLAVSYSVLSATTISTNINTDGTLTVTGASTLTGAVYASSTLQATGVGLFYSTLSAGASTNSPVTTFNVSGSGYFSVALGVGQATTGQGNLVVDELGVFNSRLGVSGTTSPYQELGVTGDAALGSAATTTLSVESTSASQGGCIELRGENNSWVRVYVGNGGGTSTTAFQMSTSNLTNGGTALLVVEQGRCQ
ncbi:hypothetical protein C4552_02625 [Candidatus Parcubacteria bacterium]|nr:MAG: hypothetical protein C4552_02625 [Candidatus Parcubacteria bacterium]